MIERLRGDMSANETEYYDEVIRNLNSTIRRYETSDQSDDYIDDGEYDYDDVRATISDMIR